MQEIELTIDHQSGLHLRPASMFVQKAATYSSEIMVRNVTKETDYRSAKSAIAVMMLKVSQGDMINIRAEGDDAADALDGLKALVESNFEEE